MSLTCAIAISPIKMAIILIDFSVWHATICFMKCLVADYILGYALFVDISACSKKSASKKMGFFFFLKTRVQYVSVRVRINIHDIYTTQMKSNLCVWKGYHFNVVSTQIYIDFYDYFHISKSCNFCHRFTITPTYTKGTFKLMSQQLSSGLTFNRWRCFC